MTDGLKGEKDKDLECKIGGRSSLCSVTAAQSEREVGCEEADVEWKGARSSICSVTAAQREREVGV